MSQDSHPILYFCFSELHLDRDHRDSWDRLKSSHPPPSDVTFDYGHPRRYTVDLLASKMMRDRSQPKTVMVADRAADFGPDTVRRAIYATGWDGER